VDDVVTSAGTAKREAIDKIWEEEGGIVVGILGGIGPYGEAPCAGRG